MGGRCVPGQHVGCPLPGPPLLQSATSWFDGHLAVQGAQQPVVGRHWHHPERYGQRCPSPGQAAAAQGLQCDWAHWTGQEEGRTEGRQ